MSSSLLRFVILEIAENTEIGRTAVLSKFCNLACDGLLRHAIRIGSLSGVLQLRLNSRPLIRTQSSDTCRRLCVDA